MIKKVMVILILAALLTTVLATVPASAAGRGSRADDLLIHRVLCTTDGAFSADGFVGKVHKNTGGVIVTIDFEGICLDGQVLSLTYTQPANLSPLPNPNAKPNGKSSGYNWSISDAIVTIPELGPVNWSATHVEVTLTNKSGAVVKETDLPLPYSPF